MKSRAIKEHKRFKPALGAALAVLCGLVLWKTPWGEAWVNSSYDYLFRFGTHGGHEQVVIILLDNEAYNSIQPNARTTVGSRIARPVVAKAGG